MWTYSQSTGEIFDPTGKRIDNGWSGQGDCFNNPLKQDVPHTGPICRGLYHIGEAYHHPKLGPCTMNLSPHRENEMFGRSLFRMHGFSKDDPETQVNETLLSSHGCVIQVRWVRELINNSDDKVLKVIL